MSVPAFASLRIESAGPVDWIVLDRPEAANAFSTSLLAELSAALAHLEEHGAPVLAIRGAGKGFSAGVDLSEYNAEATPSQDAARLRKNIDRWLEIWRHPKPVIVAIHGYCMGIAAQLPSFADLTIAAVDARIGEPAIPLGGGYIAPTWVSQVGAKRAKEFAFVPGNWIDGTTAAAWGWVNAAVPNERLIACVEALAERIARIPAPLLAMKKRSINRAAEAGGFVAALASLAESDAILHLEPSVRELRREMREKGLHDVLESYRGASSSEIFEHHAGKLSDD